MARKLNSPYSGSCVVIIVQHSTQALSPLDSTGISHMTRFGAEELIADTLVRAFPMVMGDELETAVRNDCSPNKIRRSKQDSLILRTNRSAWAFRLGER